MNAGKLVLSQRRRRDLGGGERRRRRRQYVGFDLDDPRYAFQWRERSTDDGVTWSADAGAAQGLRGLGDDADAPGLAAGQAIFAIDRDRGGRNTPHPALARPRRELDAGRRQPVRLRRRRHDRRRALPRASLGPGRLLHQGAERAGRSASGCFGGDARPTSTSTSWAASRAGVPPDGMFSVMSLAHRPAASRR